MRRTQVVVLLLAVAASAAGLAAWLHTRHTGGADGRCVTVVIASTMGGATITRCGSAAVGFCRQEAPADANVAAACRRAGFPA